jgi:hypothetical protein
VPEGGLVTSVYDVENGSVSFQFPGRDLVVAYDNIPAVPQLYPMVAMYWLGHSVEIIQS